MRFLMTATSFAKSPQERFSQNTSILAARVKAFSCNACSKPFDFLAVAAAVSSGISLMRSLSVIAFSKRRQLLICSFILWFGRSGFPSIVQRSRKVHSIPTRFTTCFSSSLRLYMRSCRLCQSMWKSSSSGDIKYRRCRSAVRTRALRLRSSSSIKEIAASGLSDAAKAASPNLVGFHWPGLIHATNCFSRNHCSAQWHSSTIDDLSSMAAYKVDCRKSSTSFGSDTLPLAITSRRLCATPCLLRAKQLSTGVQPSFRREKSLSGVVKLVHNRIDSPTVSSPVLPALPDICLYLAASKWSVGKPTYGCRKITLRAGRFTPAAKVEVAHKTRMQFALYNCSTRSRSSFDKPA
mmetsp:Transcript_1503/g.9226  ORF Transcript_1503/g.9226 Transcript_1503/m.9226 type:complete len:351 (-) Transcript_1503:1274-2326(-)